jgi:hypothetical protein
MKTQSPPHISYDLPFWMVLEGCVSSVANFEITVILLAAVKLGKAVNLSSLETLMGSRTPDTGSLPPLTEQNECQMLYKKIKYTQTKPNQQFGGHVQWS